MTPCFAKTDAGRDEIRHPSRRLARPARNLLLIIDEKHPGANWVRLVQGATPEDLQSLLADELIVCRNDAPAFRSTHTLTDALARLSREQLYGFLTSQARDRLGLVRGFFFVLEIEKCDDVADLQRLALQFMKLVRVHQGPAAMRQLGQALGATLAI